MTTLKPFKPSLARTARTRELGARIANRVRALTRYSRAASPSLNDSWRAPRSGPLLTCIDFDKAARAFFLQPQPFLRPRVLRPRAHGWLRECLRYAIDRDSVRVGIDTEHIAPIPANLLNPEHVEAGDRESNRVELGVYAQIEAQRRARARDFPGFARRYFDTGHMKQSVRMGENAGINALTGELTAWIPEPEDVEFEVLPTPSEPKRLLEYHEDEE